MKTLSLIAAAAALGLVAGLAAAQPPSGDSNSAGGGGGRAMIRRACAADFQKFCPGARPGPGGAIRQCILTHESDFSDGCKGAIAQMRAMRARQGAGGGAPS
jgi:hypothetical protein